jgi:hypothetical protein
VTIRIAALVCAAALALFATTMAPTVTLVDSGELIVVARTLGVAHPPGFPLYTLLAHAATWLPFGAIAERVHLVSAIFAALTAGVVTLIVGEMLRPAAPPEAPGARGRRRRGRVDPHEGDRHGVAVAASAAAGLLFACSRTLWAYATVAEVYTLTLFLVASALLLLVRWRRRALWSDEAATPSQGALYAAAGAAGLALAVHHVTVVLVMPAFGWLVWSVARVRPLARTTWLRAAACGAAGLALYAYLPLAAASSPLVNWGDPATPERFLWHVTGRQYQVYFSFSLDTMVRQFGDDFLPYLAREFGPRWLPLTLGLAAAGFGRLRRRDPALAAAMALIVLVDVAYALNYDIDEDKDAYYLPAFMAGAILAGVGVMGVMGVPGFRGSGVPGSEVPVLGSGFWVRGSGVRELEGSRSAEPRNLGTPEPRPPKPRLALALLLAALPLLAFVGNRPFNDRSRYFIARDYVDNVMTTVESGGMVLTRDWQVYAPWLYARHIDGARPDAVVIDVNLLRRTWYFDYLDRVYPDVMRRVRAEADAYLEDLRQWDRDPALYQRDLARNRRITLRFAALMAALVDRQRDSGAVYVTLDLLAQDADVAAILARLTAVPQGLVFQLTDEAGFVPVAEPSFGLRGLFDGSIAFEPDDVVRQKVAPAYVSMIINRGRYLAAHGRADRAEAAFREVLSIDPENEVARASLAALESRESDGVGGGAGR